MKVGWQQTTLSSISQVGAGNSAPQDAALFVEGVYPFFRTSDAGRIRFGDITESADYLNEDGIKGLRRFPVGTILFPKSGASTFLNHRVMLGVDGYVSSHLATIVGDEAKVNRRFLLYFLSTISAQNLIQDHAYPSLNLPLIAGVSVALPPLSEQHHIVAVLDDAFDSIATAKTNAEKNLQNARSLFESHLQSVFKEQRDGWINSRLGEICVFSQGIQVDVKQQTESKHSDGQVRFLRIVDFTQGNEPPRYIDNPGPKFIVSASDIALVRYGASTGFVCSGLDGAIANNLFRVIPNSTLLTAEYLLWFLRSPLFQDEIRRKMNGAAMPAISFGMINNIDLPLPTFSDQATLVGVLNELTREVRHLESLYKQKLSALDDLKKSLLHQAFSGQL